MTTSVTITGQAFDQYGRLMAVGSTQALDDAFAGSLIASGLATVASGSTYPPASNLPFERVSSVPATLTAAQGANGATDTPALDASGSTYAGNGLRTPLSATERSILVHGGDHPFKQWWGASGTGKDGRAQMLADLKIRPYLAICADDSPDVTSGWGITLGHTGCLSVDQAQTLEKNYGVEFVAHAARHPHMWELGNTGIRVYYTGAEASPTVNITTTQLTTSTATTGATNFTWSTYPTLAQLATAIKALAGWNCILATELLGTEPSSALMPLRAARSVTAIGAGDPTNSNQRFALCGGIMIRYSGTAYRSVGVGVNDGATFLSLYCDGARVLSTTTAATLTAIVAAVNALNISGLTALVCDNGYSAQTVNSSTALNPGQKFRETYCWGDEDGSYLNRHPAVMPVDHTGLQIYGGMGFAYCIRRQVLGVKEHASTYGLTIKSFAQAGGRFWPWHVRSVGDEYLQWRINRNYADRFGPSPSAMPIHLLGQSTGFYTSENLTSPTPYQEGDVKAVIDALADAPGWYVNWLNHLSTPTPGDPSPYTGFNTQTSADYTGSADQDEGPYYRQVVYAAAKRDAGQIDILPPSAAERVRHLKKPPTNLCFNAKFRNGRSDNLLGITSNATGAPGIAMPGWQVATSSSDFTVASVNANRELTLTTNGAIAAGKIPISFLALLEPGKTYEIGATIDLSAWGTASLHWQLYAIQNGMGEFYPLGQATVSSQLWYGGQRGEATFHFTVPARAKPAPACIISQAGPFTFGGTDSITLKIDNKGPTAAIAVNGLTTAKQVAAAINTAVAADSAFANFAQYHNCARAQDNRLIVEAPLLGTTFNDSQQLMEMLNSVGTPMATMFGSGVTTARATHKGSSLMDSGAAAWQVGLVLGSTPGSQTLVLSNPFVREAKYQ